MRFLIVLVLLAAGVAAFGFYRGWFHLTSDKAADQSNITLTVDTEKMQQDKQKALAKAHDTGHQSKDEAAPAPANQKVGGASN